MDILIKAYETLIYVGSLLKSPILLLCRLYWGWLFMQAGWGKLQDIDSFATELQHLNFSFAYLNAYLAAFTEFIGGICLMLGFASRLVAIPLAIVMITAYSTVHADALRDFWSDPSQFVAQAPFNFLLTTLIVFAFGPGRFSIDHLLERYVFKRA